MQFIIRKAEIKDIPALTLLLGQLFEIEEDFIADGERQRKGLELLIASEKDHIIVAEYDSKVIGTCSVQTIISTSEGGHAGLLQDLIVDSRYRGRGIGEGLLEEICVWAGSRNITRLQLLADNGNNDAIEFYIKQGWQRTKLIGLMKYL